jgi:hypothetical protein
MSTEYFCVLILILISPILFDFRVLEEQGNEELVSIYETLYPSSDPPPPPLPPRAFPPISSGGVKNSKHRPLERTRALPYQGGCNAINPPEVLRHHKPVPVLVSASESKQDCSNGKARHRHLQNQQGPSLPPKPRKLLNPEDSFAFEIIDTDELKPIQAMNMAVMGISSQNPQKPHAVSCAQLKETERHESHDFSDDNVSTRGNNSETLPCILSGSSIELKNGCKKSESGVKAGNSGELKSDGGAKSVSDNIHKRPMKLAVRDASCNGNANMKNSEGFPIVSAPLATPEQDSSLVDSSSLENLLDEDDDADFLTPDNGGAAAQSYMCSLPESLSDMQNNVAPAESSSTINGNAEYQSCTHSWPVNDVQVPCGGNQSSGSKGGMSSSHGTDQGGEGGSSEVSIDGALTDVSCDPDGGKLQLYLSTSEIPIITLPQNSPFHDSQLGSSNAVIFQDVVCESPVMLTDVPNRESQAETTVSNNSVLLDSDLSNIYASSLLPVPNPSLSSSVSPVSPNSLSESGIALSSATECSTSSSSDTNTVVLSAHSSSTDSLGAVGVVTANADVTSESGERELDNFSKNLGSQSQDDEAVSSCIDIVGVDEENTAEDDNEFADAHTGELVTFNSPSLRTHKPLSRQVSHPPMTSLGQRPEPNGAHFCGAARLPHQHQIGSDILATVPRPRNR